MKRKEIMSYYNEKYKGDTFIIGIIEERTTEELERIYKRDLIRDKKESEILENGTITYTIDFSCDLKQEVREYMQNNNMFTMFDGEINYSCGNDGRLVGVPIEFVKDLQKKYELKLSRKMYILGINDLKKLNVGDKVKLTTNGIFGNTNTQGTIHEVKDDEVIVRKYRCKSQGYRLNAGDECYIEKIDKFQKVS